MTNHEPTFDSRLAAWQNEGIRADLMGKVDLLRAMIKIFGIQYVEGGELNPHQFTITKPAPETGTIDARAVQNFSNRVLANESYKDVVRAAHKKGHEILAEMILEFCAFMDGHLSTDLRRTSARH